MTQTKLFGTDGIRGNVRSTHLLPENILKLGQVLGTLVKERSEKISAEPCITIGRDTRSSSIYLEHALIAGIISAGVDCHLLGVVPTATTAFFTRRSRSSLGAMISASHNPHFDNGIKLFDQHGFKLDEAFEQAVGDLFFAKGPEASRLSLQPGIVRREKDVHETYFSMIASSFGDNFSLCGLNVVLDCAHGAASDMARALFSTLGCTVHIIGATPDGTNINDGYGSEAPANLCQAVRELRAHIGVAFDGDADRVIFINERGEKMDGDAILASIAIDLKNRGLLLKDTMVTTVMSSVALDRALAPHHINVVRTSVGDKYVARKMLAEGFSFGGENSGHMLLFPETTTGDGIFSAVKFLAILHASALPASDLTRFFQPTPQLLKNIKVPSKIPLVSLPKTQDAIAQANERLRNFGRVLLRYSGTENKARLLVEAPTESDCHRIADEIANLFDIEIGAALSS